MHHLESPRGLNAFRAILVATRPNFLLLPVVLVVLGFASALSSGSVWNWSAFLFTVLGAILAHAWVNLHNEITDSRNQLDARTPKTPFSGGTGTFVQKPGLLPLATRLLKGLLVVLLAMLAGFTWLYGIELFLLALLGGGLMLSYSGWLVHKPWLCWASAGLAFGPLMVVSAAWVASQSITVESALLSIVVFFWVNNLLLLNQVPDYFADQTVARSNVVIHYGLRRALWIYSASAGMSLLVLWMMAWQVDSSTWLLFALVWSLVIGWQVLSVFNTYQQMPEEFKEAFEQKVSDLAALPDNIANHNFKEWHRVLGVNVIINIVLPISLSALLILTA